MILRWLLGKWELLVAAVLGGLTWFFRWRASRHAERADKAEAKVRHYKDRQKRREKRRRRMEEREERQTQAQKDLLDEIEEHKREGKPREGLKPWGE